MSRTLTLGVNLEVHHNGVAQNFDKSRDETIQWKICKGFFFRATQLALQHEDVLMNHHWIVV